MNVYEKLMNVQRDLKAPKGQLNKFGGYMYRSCEDIMEAVKPLLAKNKLILNVSDSVELIGDRYYVKATVKVIDTESCEAIDATANAREALEKKGNDASQITGTASSYARKYALNGLFCIDDNKDDDVTNDDDPEKVANEKIDEMKIETIRKLADEKQADVEKMFQRYEIKSFKDMRLNQWVNAMEILRKK